MGFSLKSFLGGAAGAGSRGIEKRRDTLQREKETAEARQWQIATESRADSRAKKAARTTATREAEEQIGTLIALGMPATEARAVAKNGKGAIKVAIGDLQYGRENGVNAASYYTMGQKGLLQGDASSNIKAAEPAGLTVDSEGIRSMYGAVDEDYNSHNEQVRAITNKQFKLTAEDPEYVKLETQREALYRDMSEIAAANKANNKDDGRKFSEGTVRATIGGELNRQLLYRGMSYDIEKQVIVGMEGDVLGANIASLKTANIVRESTKSVDDQFMRDSINALQKNAIVEIRINAAEKLRENPKIKTQPIVPAADYIKPDFESTLTIGQLVRIPDESSPNGGKLVMYIGVPGMEYLDVFKNEDE